MRRSGSCAVGRCSARWAILRDGVSRELCASDGYGYGTYAAEGHSAEEEVAGNHSLVAAAVGESAGIRRIEVVVGAGHSFRTEVEANSSSRRSLAEGVWSSQSNRHDASRGALTHTVAEEDSHRTAAVAAGPGYSPGCCCDILGLGRTTCLRRGGKCQVR